MARKSKTWINAGKNIAAMREAKGLSQRDLADKADLSRPAVSNLENGYPPHGRTLEKVAGALGCDVRDLMEPAA